MIKNTIIPQYIQPFLNDTVLSQTKLESFSADVLHSCVILSLLLFKTVISFVSSFSLFFIKIKHFIDDFFL